MVIFGDVKSCGCKVVYFGHDRVDVHLAVNSFDFIESCELTRLAKPDSGTILRSHVVTLSIFRSRVVYSKKYVEKNLG